MSSNSAQWFTCFDFCCKISSLLAFSKPQLISKYTQACLLSSTQWSTPWATSTSSSPYRPKCPQFHEVFYEMYVIITCRVDAPSKGWPEVNLKYLNQTKFSLSLKKQPHGHNQNDFSVTSNVRNAFHPLIILMNLHQSIYSYALYLFAACQWGDRYMDCRNADCTDPKIREYCCETCSTISVPEATTTLSPLSPGNESVNW